MFSAEREFIAEIQVEFGGRGLPVIEKFIGILIRFTFELDRLQKCSNFDVINSGLTIMRRNQVPDSKVLLELIGDSYYFIERFLSSYTNCRNIHQSANAILNTFLHLLYCFKTRYGIIQHRICWENCIIIIVKFQNAFDFEAGRRGFQRYSLSGDIFEHFREILSYVSTFQDNQLKVNISRTRNVPYY